MLKKEVEGIKNVSSIAVLLEKFLFTCAWNTTAPKGVQFYKGKLISYLPNAQTIMYFKIEQYKLTMRLFKKVLPKENSTAWFGVLNYS